MALIEQKARTPSSLEDYIPPKLITPAKSLRENGFNLVGVIPVIACVNGQGVEILLGEHKAGEDIEEGQIGIPREKIKWDEESGRDESLATTTWRCYEEELALDASTIPLTVSNDSSKRYVEISTEFPDGSLVLARTCVLWTPTTDWSNSIIETEELRSAKFVSLDTIFEAGTKFNFRELTIDVLAFLADQGVFTERGSTTLPLQIIPTRPFFEEDFHYKNL